jgi:hypothetical protein
MAKDIALTQYAKPSPEREFSPSPVQVSPASLELIITLEQLAEILESTGNVSWSAKVYRVKSGVQNADHLAIHYVLSAYEGGNSINHVALPRNANVSEAQHRALSEKFSLLRQNAWRLAIAIKRFQL